MGVFKGKSKNTWREWRDAPWCTMMYLCTFGDGDAEGGSPCSCTRTSKAVQADLTAHLGHQRRRTRPAGRRWDEWVKGWFWGYLAGKIYLARGMLNKNVPTPLEKHAIQQEHNGIGGWRGQFRSTSCSEGAASRVSEGPLPWQAVETQSLRL